jgi:hypothetical protein
VPLLEAQLDALTGMVAEASAREKKDGRGERAAELGRLVLPFPER